MISTNESPDSIPLSGRKSRVCPVSLAVFVWDHGRLLTGRMQFILRKQHLLPCWRAILFPGRPALPFRSAEVGYSSHVLRPGIIRHFNTSPKRNAVPLAALLLKLAGPLSKVSKVAAVVGGR